MNHAAWTWSREWMWPGMSVAAMLLRFSMANCLDVQTAGQLYRGVRRLPSSGLSFYGGLGNDFQDARIASLLGVEACEVRMGRLADVIERLSRASFMDDRLRICPDCIELGYHAIYFQIEALEVCPVHHKPLVSNCPSCQAPLPFFGICMQLLETPFFCNACGASLGREPARLGQFFLAPEIRERYAERWAPVQRWLTEVSRAGYAFGNLRNWGTLQLPFERTPRMTAVVDVLKAIVQLPTALTWRSSEFAIRAVHLHDCSLLDRDVRADTQDCLNAYRGTLRSIEYQYLDRSVNALVRSLRREDWRVISPRALAELSEEELAYVLWRMHFEQKGCASLLQITPSATCLYIEAGTAPSYWRDISRRLWTLLFRASYASLLWDVRLCIKEGNRFADFDRLPVDRNYFVLPKSDLRPSAGGLLIYPMLGKRKTASLRSQIIQ